MDVVHGEKSAIALTIIYILCNKIFANPNIPNFNGTWEGLCSTTNAEHKAFKDSLQISQNFSPTGETEIIINDESFASGEIETDVHSNVKTGTSTNEITYTHWDTVSNEFVTSTVKVSKSKNASRLAVVQDEWTMKLEDNKLIIERKSTSNTTAVICSYNKEKG